MQPSGILEDAAALLQHLAAITTWAVCQTSGKAPFTAAALLAAAEVLGRFGVGG